MKKRNMLYSVIGAGAIAATTLTTGNLFAYGSAGCGLGSMVIKDNGPAQIFAATTNGTFSNQTFAMTFGTLNCPPSEALIKAEADKKQEVFVTVNFSALEQEMAAGKGEKLNAFSELLGCKDAGAFGKMTQKNYGKFFAQSEVTPAALLGSVKGELSNDASLQCQLK